MNMDIVKQVNCSVGSDVPLGVVLISARFVVTIVDQGSTYEQTAHQRLQSMMTILELCLVHTTLNTAANEGAPFNSTMDTMRIPGKGREGDIGRYII